MISGWEPTGESRGHYSGFSVGDFVLLRKPPHSLSIRIVPGSIVSIFEARVPPKAAASAPKELNMQRWRRMYFFIDWNIPADATPIEKRYYNAKLRCWVQMRDIQKYTGSMQGLEDFDELEEF